MLDVSRARAVLLGSMEPDSIKLRLQLSLVTM